MVSPEILKIQLQDLMLLDHNWDSYNAEPPSMVAFGNAETILDEMKTHHLEGSRIIPSIEGGVTLIWTSSFNDGHYAQIDILNNKTVIAMICDRDLEDVTDSNFLRFWWVSDFTQPYGDPGIDIPGEDELQLTLEETLEKIRHHIWVSHE